VHRAMVQHHGVPLTVDQAGCIYRPPMLATFVHAVCSAALGFPVCSGGPSHGGPGREFLHLHRGPSRGPAAFGYAGWSAAIAASAAGARGGRPAPRVLVTQDAGKAAGSSLAA
jgi:hypothetical protein